MKRWIGFMFGAVLGFGALVPQAGAVFTGGELNEIDFTNRENIFDAVTTAPKSPSIFLPYFGLGLGDHLAGVLRVETIDGPSGATFLNDVSAPIDQITGAYAQKIIGLAGFPGVGAIGTVPAIVLGPTIVFGNPTTFTFFDPATAGTFTVPLAAGEMFAFYSDSGLPGTVVDPLGVGSMTGSHAISTDGTKILTLGLDGTDGLGADGLIGTADDTGYVYSTLAGPVSGLQRAGLYLKFNLVVPTPVTPIINPADDLLSPFRGPLPVELYFKASFAPNPLFVGPDGTLGTGDDAGYGNTSLAKSAWAFASDDPANVFPFVPEPSSLWLLGMGLSGLGVFRRRKLLS